MDVNICMCTKS